ncbi:MAG: outer membrane protein transport protein [Gammaproteobacteria bacterium]|jgi:long-chain fatty acid transport protein
MSKSRVAYPSAHLLSAGILATLSSGTLASGFALVEQSASQMGNAFAGGASFANDASTLFFNPAGLTRVSHQLVGAAHLIMPYAKFDGTATDPLGNPASGGNGGDTRKLSVVGNLYYNLPLGHDLFFGMGINVPFGLATDYDDDWKGRYHAIESEVRTVNFNPTLAYKLNGLISVGAGVNLQYIDGKLTQAIDQGSLCRPALMAPPPAGIGADFPTADATCNSLGLTPQGNDAVAKVTGNNWAMGYNLGVLLQPTDRTRVGLSYRSKVKQQLTGNARFRDADPLFTDKNVFVSTDATADIDLPQSASLSVYHDINRKWAVMADVSWTGWDTFKELRIDYDSFQPDTVVDESWNDTMRYALGVDYRPNSKWTLRAGTAYDETPIPDASHRTPRIPGEDRVWLSVGFGYQFNQALAVDVGYAHLFIPDDPEMDTSSPSTGSITGDYDAKVDLLSAQLVWNI